MGGGRDQVWAGRREFVMRKGSAPGTAWTMSAERTMASPRANSAPGVRASRGSVQYREGARAGQVRERRENGEADGQRILRGDDLVAHEVTQGVGGSAPRRPQPLPARVVAGRPALAVVGAGPVPRLARRPARH